RQRLRYGGQVGRAARRLLVFSLSALTMTGLAVACWYWLDHFFDLRYIGDYRTDADASLERGLGGHIFALYTTNPRPLMLPFALLTRVAGLAVAKGFGLGAVHHLLGRYQVGSIT